MAFSPRYRRLLLTGALTALLIACATRHPTASRTPDAPATFQYPAATRGTVVDDYHGTQVADPYRWFENLGAQDTRDWVTAENALSQPYLEALPQRAWLR